MHERILVVDEDWFLADMLAETFRQQGLAAATASTVAEAIALCEQDPPDLLLLDLRLPDGDGWSMVTRARSLHVGRPLPVVVVSSSPVMRRDLREYAIEAYISKPFRIPQLLERVTGLLAAG